ncbi:hypothetical protein Tco_1359405 [Tanacetum coccineum]
MRMKDKFLVGEKIALSKQDLIAPLAAAGIDSYTRAYPFVVKLHVLQEREDFHSILNGESFLEKSLVFGANGLNSQVGNCGIQYAKLCRSAGHYETANRAILEANASGAANAQRRISKRL